MVHGEAIPKKNCRDTIKRLYTEKGQRRATSCDGQIYKGAMRVLIWLGRDEENLARLALNKFRCLKNIFDDGVQLKKFTEDQKECLETLDDGSWPSLRKFYNLPWVSLCLPGTLL